MEQLFKILPVSGMTKARLDDKFVQFTPQREATALRGDRFYFSVLATAETTHGGVRTEVRTESALTPYIKAYLVDQVPVRLPHYNDRADDDYIDHKPGLYPDLLRPFEHFYMMDQMHQVYFEVNVPKDFAPGVYPIDIVFSTISKATNNEMVEVARDTVTLEVLDAELPPLDIQTTMWFHYDCLADYYNVEVFSERHWEIIENFMVTYVDSGMNTILTPLFTPPLDTNIGGERPTVQLVDVVRTNGKYSFGFEKLERFLALCRKVGITDLELSHLFTQWGAEHAPKIMATDDGVYRRIFGWESDSFGEDYVTFLHAFIPAVRAKLDELGFKGHYFFHLSDEPHPEHYEAFDKARRAIWHLVEDCPVRDALGNYAMYERGAVCGPIVSNSHIEEFIEKGVKNLWVYYCCSQGRNTSNRFLSMPGYRTRVMGAQMYNAEAIGFLQWGYNFYYSTRSRYAINPYLVNDSDYAFPAGDAFIVYPDCDGKPLKSLHGVLFEQALLDLRAMKAAEARVGREKVMQAVESHGKISYIKYPRGEAYLLTLRDTANRLAASK